MRVSGIDLASQPSRTAVAVLEWSPRPNVLHLSLGADDDAVVDAAVGTDKCGVDAPLGWPDAFVDVVSRHHAGAVAAVPESMQALRLRATDIWVWRRHGRIPLSVSTDNIGVVALRCVRIQQLVAARTGEPVDRTGGGRLAEVYPAAALAAWGLPHSGYKRGEQAARQRSAILDGLCQRFDLRPTRRQRELAVAEHDALDALVSAVVSALVAGGQTLPPPPKLVETAAREGWIHVPSET